jgi:outer membrane protein TolC
LRGEIAEKEAQLSAEQYHTLELAVAERVKRAYFSYQHTYAERDVLDRSRQLLESLLHVAEARYAAGKTPQQDVFRAQEQIYALEEQLVESDRERRSAEAEINSLLNRAIDSPLGEPSGPHAEEFTITLNELYAKLPDGSALLRRDRQAVARSQLALRLTEREHHPDFAISAGYYNQHPMPPMYMIRLDVTLPLFASHKQDLASAEEGERLAGAGYAVQADTQSLRFAIKDEYLSARAALDLLKLYSETLLPQTRLTVESSLASYQTGVIDLLSVLNNYTAALDYEMKYHEQMRRFHLSLIRLEAMTGLKLTH